MHARQFFLGMKFFQNGVLEFIKNEQQRIDRFRARQYINTRDRVGPDGSNVRKKTPW